ncbi:MAG TPA: hypothetical protein DHW65_06410 [Dehalococcoidia bacterium]|nr:hypothetical protein [Chloroflexota bacterium]HCL25960.1 hypothetical protein [Dehalococcoidia bacterium]
MSQLRQQYGDIQTKGATVVAVSFEPQERLFQLTRQLRLPFPVLSDPERTAYAAYGLVEGSWLKIFSPRTVWTYLKLLFRGRRYHHAASDWKQLGGDFILGEFGTVVFEHRGEAPHDRPSVARLIEQL